MSTSVTVKKQGTDFNQLKKGTVISETQYYTVEAVEYDSVDLKNDDGEVITVGKSYAESCLTTADQFNEERIVNRTEAAHIFLSNPYTAMTVNFNKKVDEKAVLAELLNVHNNTAPKDVEKQFKATLKKVLEGEERTMVGRHSASQDEFGRVQFVDMEVEKKDGAYDNRQRLVDPRTINWLIVKGVKYRVK